MSFLTDSTPPQRELFSGGVRFQNGRLLKKLAKKGFHPSNSKGVVNLFKSLIIDFALKIKKSKIKLVKESSYIFSYL